MLSTALWLLFIALAAAGWWLVLFENDEGLGIGVMGLALVALAAATGAERRRRRALLARWNLERSTHAGGPARERGGFLDRLTDAFLP